MNKQLTDAELAKIILDHYKGTKMKPEIHLKGSEWLVKLKVSHDFGMSSADLTFHSDGGKFKFYMMESDARDLANFILENTSEG